MMNDRPYSPLDPEYGPNAFDMLSAYRQKSATMRAQAQQMQDAQPDPAAFNPYGQDSSGNEQDQHVSNLEQWLSPVKMDVYSPQGTYTIEKHNNFMKNLADDPAVKDYGDQFHGYLDSLLGAVQSNQIDMNQAQSMAQDYFENQVVPTIDKHHKASDSGSFHKKREPEIPDIVKKVRGGKR